MKRTLVLTTVSLTVLLLVFHSARAQTENDSKIHFQINGTAENGEGQVLALLIPSLGEDNRLKSKIVGGKFQFEGTLDRAESATIVFNHEIEEPDGIYFGLSLFLTDDTMDLQAVVAVEELYGNFKLDQTRFSGSPINEHYYKTLEEYFDLYQGVVYKPREKEYMDSLRREVFPDIRKNLLEKNLELYGKTEYSLLNLHYLRNMFKNRYVFNKNDLDSRDKDLFKQAFARVDKSLDGSPDFEVVESYMKKSIAQDQQFGFKDYILIDHNEQKKSLSEIISQNEYTVLEFWISWCGPCRNFNQKGQKIYSSLKEKGIEIISINMDEGVSKWRAASTEDNLQWIDLYAGDIPEMQVEYNVIGFPTKYVFDKDKNLVELDFQTAEELLVLVDKK